VADLRCALWLRQLQALRWLLRGSSRGSLPLVWAARFEFTSPEGRRVESRKWGAQGPADLGASLCPDGAHLG
jgi:hypothetical protein